MVSTLTIERNPMTFPGSRRAMFAAALLITLSAFAKETASVVIDLPQTMSQTMIRSTTHTQPLPVMALASPVVPAFILPAPAAAPVVKTPHRLALLKDIRTGMASWYGKVLQDHLTASGRRFDMAELTAAHRTLPFGSLVRVVDLRNHKSVIVTITDRGVLNADRVIDLSLGAAQQLDMVKRGVDPVRLEVLNKKQIALLAQADPVPTLP